MHVTYKKKIKKCFDVSQQDKVVITRCGKPAAILVGVAGRDWTDVALSEERLEPRQR
jgi:hypothetical protein